jgi:NTE family protein
MAKKKFALVLSGGAFRGAFQLGALRYLKDNWTKIDPDSENGAMKFDIVTGVSVGALNGVMIASNKFDELNELWEKVRNEGPKAIYTSDFIDTSSQSDTLQFKIDSQKLLARFLPGTSKKFSFWTILKILVLINFRKKFIKQATEEFKENFKTFRSLADNQPLQAKLKDYVNIDSVKDCIFKCGFVSLNNGRYYSFQPNEFNSDEDFRKAVLASTAIPIVWEPVKEIQLKKDAEILKNTVDGGVRNVGPIAEVIKEIGEGEEFVIVIINCRSVELEEWGNRSTDIASIALRSLNEIAITEIFNSDYETFLKINDILDQLHNSGPPCDKPILDYDYYTGQRGNRKLRKFKSIIIQPDRNQLGDELVVTPEIIDRRVEIGRQKAEEAVKVYLAQN